MSYQTAMNIGDRGKCDERRDRRFGALFCSAHCRVFGHSAMSARH
jgi:hypothetical protein